jgi:hypothetical protein
MSCSVSIFSTDCNSASITSILLNGGLQFYLQSGKERKVGWVGDDSHLVFSQKFPGEKV